ncbi:MAG: serine/threonine protein kinase [Deltaproteobacteria bacterium]|nr:serine/threonine protein kinase [Deltaproteobacteria bacterium]
MDELDSSLQNSGQLKVGSLIAERYCVEKVLGVGGMGTVYLARDSVLKDEQVAVKILHSQLSFDTSCADRFLREVQLMRRVSHANVVRTYDVGINEHLIYFTMEYIPGKSLFNLISEDSPTLSQLVDISCQICEGLEAIHQAKIIHRDLKPDNVIVLDNSIVKITDFGVARPELSALTAHNEIIGSSPYIAPEIWLGDKITHAVDLYSLGVLLYETFTRVIPFQADTPAAAMHMHLNQKPIPPIEHNSEIPSWLNRLILNLLSKSPAGRPSSAAEVLDIINTARRRSKRGATLGPNTTVESSDLLQQLEVNSRKTGKSQLDTANSKAESKRDSLARTSKPMRIPSITRSSIAVSNIGTLHPDAYKSPAKLAISKTLSFAFAIMSSAIFAFAAQHYLGSFLANNSLMSQICLSLTMCVIASFPNMCLGAISGRLTSTLSSFFAAFCFHIVSFALLIIYFLSPLLGRVELNTQIFSAAMPIARSTISEIALFSPSITTYQTTILSDGLIFHSPNLVPVFSSTAIYTLAIAYILMICFSLLRFAGKLQGGFKKIGIPLAVATGLLLFGEATISSSSTLTSSALETWLNPAAERHSALPEISSYQIINWGFIYVTAFALSIANAILYRFQKVS